MYENSLNYLKIKFFIHTFGCKTNQAETDRIIRELTQKGLNQVGLEDMPEFVIVNSCTVTAAADKKVRQFVRKIKKHNQNAILITMGCYAALNSELLKKEGADYVLCRNDKEKIEDIVMEIIGKNRQLKRIFCQGAKVINSRCEELKSEGSDVIFSKIHSRALVKIQDGCQQGCSYCIVPLVRGLYVSRSTPAVLDEIYHLGTEGFEEIVLTGIHIGKYGIGIEAEKEGTGEPGEGLSFLIKQILRKTPVKRLRLSSLEINEIDNELIDLLSESNGRITRHLHIPLQSGSNNILRNMNRPYTSQYYLERISQIKDKVPEITLTTDIIVGFPGESDQDFEFTEDAIKKVNFCKIHVFMFSGRPGTAAERMDNQLDRVTIKNRSRQARQLAKEMRQHYMKSFIGKNLEVVCEEFDGSEGIASGTSENYIKVYFKLDRQSFAAARRKIISVKSLKVFNDGIWGIYCNS